MPNGTETPWHQNINVRKREGPWKRCFRRRAKACYDNAPVETFFKTLKAELVWRTKFATRLEAEISIRNHINNFYNSRRRHSALGNISPMRYENIAA
ncbi:MAG: hypothetical protein COB46_02810 [Rhodospirillaceae bacterium]|nr:MAG: hypothetical protein COB46_02810 [Rhodospirillaceae bacterium]